MTTNIQNAINRSRQIKMSVKYLGNRSYLVVTPENHRYTVRAEMHDGLRYMVCNCKAAQSNLCCKHVIKAALVDTAIQTTQGH